jgi:tripartite-type tricarboxylate transporter receptor subunit TctC
MCLLKRLGPIVAILVTASIGNMTGAFAESAKDFYSNHQVTYIVPAGTGGGYALYGQIFSNHLGKHLPGNPTVIIKYMPGGGGNVAANYLYNVAPKDGSVISSLFSTLTVTQALHPSGAHFDATKFSWLGSIAPMINAVGVWHDAKAHDVEAAKNTEVVMGATGKSSDLYIYPQIMNTVLGTKFKIVLGYDSSGAILLAMQKGEAQGMAMGLEVWYATRPAWMKDKKVLLIAQTGAKRSKLIPDVPTLTELAKSADDKKIMTFLAAPAVLGRVVAAPPGIPADRLAVLRKAFDATMKDEDFRKDLTSRHLSVDPSAGPEILAYLKEVSATPKPLIDRTKKLLGF